MKKSIIILVLMLFSVKSYSPPYLYNRIEVKTELDFNGRLRRDRPELFVLAMRESAKMNDSIPNWAIVNSIGCIGGFQIKHRYLKSLGFDFTLEQFIEDPSIFPPDSQVVAVCIMMNRNMKILEPYFDRIGDTIRGIEITQNGIMFAAHIAGAGGVQKFFKYGYNPEDANGTSLVDYLDYKRTFKRKNIEYLFYKLE